MNDKNNIYDYKIVNTTYLETTKGDLKVIEKTNLANYSCIEECNYPSSVPKDYWLVCCVNSDYSLKDYSASTIINKNLRKSLKRHYPINKKGDCLVTYSTAWRGEFNLVVSNTKKEKPNLKTLKQVLINMKTTILEFPIDEHKIAIPQKICGIDITDMIKQVFKNANVKILICKKS